MARTYRVWALCFVLCLGSVLSALPAHAELLPPTDPIDGLGGGGNVDEGRIRGAVFTVIIAFLGIVGIIAVIVIIIAGTRLILAGGNEETARTARRQILYAVIGLVVILLSVVIVNFVIRALPD